MLIKHYFRFTIQVRSSELQLSPFPHLKVEFAAENGVDLSYSCVVVEFLQGFLSFQPTTFAKIQSSSPSLQPTFCFHADLSGLIPKKVSICFQPLLNSSLEGSARSPSI